MAICWCRRCFTLRKGDWRHRAEVELRSAAAEGRRSWAVALVIRPGDLPAELARRAPPERVDAFASRALQLWLKRVRKAGLGLRYAAAVDRRGSGGATRYLRVLVHELRPGAVVPGDLRQCWPWRAVVRRASPADAGRLAPRCERVCARASLRYGPRPRPFSVQSAEDGAERV